ncbi:MAG: SRPBCC family protein [Ornithinimicrobium sp.]
MSDEKQITVSRSIDVSNATIFEVLSNPEHHAAIDGSGFVLSDDRSDRITGTGQVFTMNMSGDHMGGDYKTDNHVTGYDPGKLLAWQTAPAGTQPPGWQWVWELTPTGPDATDVSLTYDWSGVTDQDLLSKLSFPLVTQEQLEDSLAHLAEAVSGS